MEQPSCASFLVLPTIQQLLECLITGWIGCPQVTKAYNHLVCPNIFSSLIAPCCCQNHTCSQCNFMHQFKWDISGLLPLYMAYVLNSVPRKFWKIFNGRGKSGQNLRPITHALSGPGIFLQIKLIPPLPPYCNHKGSVLFVKLLIGSTEPRLEKDQAV